MTTVLILGGGFSGAMVAAQLVSRIAAQIILIERRAVVGRGLAYSAVCQDLLLNAPASRMSALPNDNDAFFRWLRKDGYQPSAPAFVPRFLYGSYIKDTLSRATARGRFDVVRDEAVDLEKRNARFYVRLASGKRLSANAVVLALGHAPPRPLGTLIAATQSSRIIDNPLEELSRLTPRCQDTVVLLGTGLTAMDVAIWLRSHGHRGRIVAVSRHGLLPCAYATDTVPPLATPPQELTRIASALDWFRATGRQIAAGGMHPSCVIDMVRPHLSRIWSQLCNTERQRFLRHLRAIWEVYRHRAAPATHEAVENAIRDGWMEVRAGRVLRIAQRRAEHLRVDMTSREGKRTWVEASWVVNCTGPERDVARQPGALTRALVTRGLIRRDVLGLGVHTGHDGELHAAAGQPVAGAYTLGPWRVADLWESTAVPELRCQAVAVALALTKYFELRRESYRQRAPQTRRVDDRRIR
jgi:uncharacterized NAD(P)/FAD-binding protein YdhS